MRHVLALVLAAGAALAGAAQAVDVYKWRDGKGVVHYGDRPPSDASAVVVSVPDDAPDPDDLARSRQRLSDAQDSLRDAAGDEPPVAPPSLAPPSRTPSDAGTCAWKWRLYMASQGCFDRHRAAGGKGVTPAGTRICPQIVQPDCTP